MDACAIALSEFPPVPDVLRERDACAMIRRCHRFQHPHEYGGREGVVVWTPELIVMVAERPEGPDDAAARAARDPIR